MVRSRFHHVVTADDSQFGQTMKRLPATTAKAAAGIRGGMNRASQAIDKAAIRARAMGGALRGMGAAMGSFLAIQGLSKVITDFDRIGKLAIRFGESAESIQRVSHAANLAGADLEKTAKAMTQATRAAQEAIDGNAIYAESFERLGINAAEFVNMSIEEKLKAISTGFLGATTEAEGMSAVMNLLGSRMAGELIPLFRQGGDAMQEAFDAVNPASQKTVDNIQKLNDRWTSLKAAAAGPLATMVSGLEGVISAIMVAIEAVKGLGNALGEAIGGAIEALKAAFSGDFDFAKELLGNISQDVDTALQAAADKVGERYEKMKDDFFGEGTTPERGTGTEPATLPPDVASSASSGIQSSMADAAEMAFEAAQKSIDDAAQRAEADRAFTHKSVNRGGGLVGMMARIAGDALKNPALMAAAKKATAPSLPMTDYQQLQADKAAGVQVGTNTLLSSGSRRLGQTASRVRTGVQGAVGGLGAHHALSRERFDARKRAREEAKNQIHGVEKTNSLLSNIERDLRTNLTVSAN